MRVACLCVSNMSEYSVDVYKIFYSNVFPIERIESGVV